MLDLALGVIARSVEISFTVTFHTEATITTKLAGDGQTMRTTLDATPNDLFGEGYSEANQNIEFCFNRNLSATLFVAQRTILVECVIRHS
jgi:hypothetical protein